MQIEVWSDIACPWCYLGKRRLERALGAFPHRDQVELTWRSFQLSPGAPRFGEPGAGVPVVDHLAGKFGGEDRARAAFAHVAGAAAEDGIEYRLDDAAHVNTFDAHRVLHLAAGHRAAGAVKERLLRAHLCEGLRVDDPEVLTDLAAAAGVPAERTRSVLAGDEYAEAVAEDVADARRLGITGVPFFVFDRRFGISGAHPAELFSRALERAWEVASGDAASA